MKQRKEEQWEKLMKPKTGSLKGSIKLIKKKKKNSKTDHKRKTIWKRGNIIPDPIEIKRLMRKCYIYKP